MSPGICPGDAGFDFCTATPADVPAHVSAELARAWVESLRPRAPMQSLAVEGLQFPLYRQGSGSPLLFVHGLGHDASDFLPLFTSPPAGFEVAALDLPGFGLADKPRRDYPLALLADAVLAAAAALDAPPVVIGSSLGGHVSALAARARPDAFAGLVLVSPGGLSPTPLALQAVARRYYSYEAVQARSDEDIVRNARRIFAEPSPAREAQAARKLALHRSPLRATFAWPFAEVVRGVFADPIGALLGTLPLPIALISGERDVVVSAVECRIAADRARIPFHLLRGLGHLPMREDPERFHQTLLEAIGPMRAQACR